jgi:hypothetical protein
MIAYSAQTAGAVFSPAGFLLLVLFPCTHWMDVWFHVSASDNQSDALVLRLVVDV